MKIQFKRWILLVSVALAMVGCDYVSPNPYFEWKEEVKLNDGRTIVVEQKKRLDGRIAREDWLTIDLPEFSKQKIVWHESLSPLIVNVDQGNLYVVGMTPTIVEFRKYGRPPSSYLAYVWTGTDWKRIPFDDIPKSIYETNMYLGDVTPNFVTHVSLEDKKKQRLVGFYADWMLKLRSDAPTF